ncbi:MAG: NAD(P)/FAD-dependent oxidoreductase [Candidatus Levyibacteriota bacterium]
MKIAIIGAGFTGLSSAYQLVKQGHEVTVFEKDPQPGGLAIGYQEKEWEWSLEKHYHHWFTNDKFILGLAKEIGHPILIKHPKTTVYVDGEIFPFDSPKDILMFPKLPLIDKVRMGVVGGLLRYNPFWKPLEKFNATKFLPAAMGEKSYKMIWEPLFHNKFGPLSNDISLAWFWARLTKRTFSLAYPEGGFLQFAQHLVKVIEEKGGTVNFNTELLEVTEAGEVTLKYKNAHGKGQTQRFDKVIFTLPSVLFLKTAPQLPETYRKQFGKRIGLGATNLVLRLKKQFFKDDTYWVSVCDPTSPVMAVVEHTHFMNKSHYNNESLLYLGNYMPADSDRFRMEKDEVLKMYDPFLRKLNPDYKKSLIGYELFKAPFAQPIIPANYSKMIPPMITPLKNVYLANMEQVYPWDRGTNYAVELGEKVAKMI